MTILHAINVQRVTGGAPIPTREHEHDAGLDLCFWDDDPTPITMRAGARVLFGTGIAVAIPPGYVGLVCPRSGLAAKKGVTVLNAPGIIDSGYRGELKVLLHNTNQVGVGISRGDRIAQLLVVPVALPRLYPVDQLSAPADGRGDNGFGSTGS